LTDKNVVRTLSYPQFKDSTVLTGSSYPVAHHYSLQSQNSLRSVLKLPLSMCLYCRYPSYYFYLILVAFMHATHPACPNISYVNPIMQFDCTFFSYKLLRSLLRISISLYTLPTARLYRLFLCSRKLEQWPVPMQQFIIALSSECAPCGYLFV
jgi:hypothetical protein